MTGLVTELKALKEKIDGNLHALPGSDCIMVDTDLVARFDKNAPAPQKRLVVALVNHLPTILAKLEEGEGMRETLGRLVSEYDDDGEHGKHAYERECPLCCAIEDARKFTALEPTHDHT